MKIGKKREKAKLLEETWPAVFNFDKPKPLKVGIFEDMCAHIPEEERKTFKIAMRAYCGRATYLWALTKHTHRYDLEGNPFIEITDDERAFAQKQIKNSNLRLQLLRAKSPRFGYHTRPLLYPNVMNVRPIRFQKNLHTRKMLSSDARRWTSVS